MCVFFLFLFFLFTKFYQRPTNTYRSLVLFPKTITSLHCITTIVRGLHDNGVYNIQRKRGGGGSTNSSRGTEQEFFEGGFMVLEMASP